MIKLRITKKLNTLDFICNPERIKKVATALVVGANVIKQEAKSNVAKGYVKHGYSPISDAYADYLYRTGNLPHDGLIGIKEEGKHLLNSFTVRRRDGGLKVILQVDRKYGLFINEGTKKMPARPFFDDAVLEKREKVFMLIRTAYLKK